MLPIQWYKTKARMWKIDNRVHYYADHYTAAKRVVQSTLLSRCGSKKLIHKKLVPYVAC